MFSIKITRLLAMLRQNRSWLVNDVVRSLSTSSQSLANHYDVLEITPKATQNDIKSAYYKLSKVYHPDKLGGEVDAKKFRQIKEAYEVLGNLNLKKMYDKGLLVGRENTTRMHYQPDPEPTDPTLKFYKSRMDRKVATMPDGTAPIYDFDAWSKHHYGDLVKKKKASKDFMKKAENYKSERIMAERQEGIIYIMIGLSALFAIMVGYGKDDYDRVQQATKNAQNNLQPIEDK